MQDINDAYLSLSGDIKAFRAVEKEIDKQVVKAALVEHTQQAPDADGRWAFEGKWGADNEAIIAAARKAKMTVELSWD